MESSNLIHGTFILLTLVLRGGAAQAPYWQEIQSRYQRAKEAIRAKQDDVAVKEFREILRLDPQNAEAHANLG